MRQLLRWRRPRRFLLLTISSLLFSSRHCNVTIINTVLGPDRLVASPSLGATLLPLGATVSVASGSLPLARCVLTPCLGWFGRSVWQSYWLASGGKDELYWYTSNTVSPIIAHSTLNARPGISRWNISCQLKHSGIFDGKRWLEMAG